MGWFSQSLAVPLSGTRVTPWQNPARCTWHHPAPTSCDHLVLVWLDPVLKQKEKPPVQWLSEDLFHLSSGMQKPWLRTPWLSGWARSPHSIP